MSWIRLDDQIAHHPKILRCSPGACWLYVTCIGYAQKFLTNGFIPNISLATISHLRSPEKSVRQLVTAGLLEKVEGGLQIHDYLHFNDSKDEAIERKSHIHQVRSDAGKLGASRRWQTDSNLPYGKDGKPRIAPSHPIPSYKEQKISAAASPRKASNGNGHRGAKDNIRVITKIVHSIMDEAKDITGFADIKADVKDACSKKHIAYDAEVVGSAIESALAARSK